MTGGRHRARSPRDTRSDVPNGHCGGCGRRWFSLVQCHCPTCHRQFAGITGFDRHRIRASSDPTNRMCADPEQLITEAGELVFVASHERHGVVWRHRRDDPRWQTTLGRESTK